MIVNNKLQLKQWIFNAFRLECFSIDEKSRRLILSGCGLFSVRTSKFHKQIVFLVVFSGHSQLNNSIEELRSRRICYQSLSTLWINSQMWTSNSLFRPRRLLWFVLCMFLFCPTQCWNDFSYRAANCIQSESNGFAILWHSVPLFSIGIICMISDESHMRRNVLKWNETRLVCVAFCIFELPYFFLVPNSILVACPLIDTIHLLFKQKQKSKKQFRNPLKLIYCLFWLV